MQVSDLVSEKLLARVWKADADPAKVKIFVEGTDSSVFEDLVEPTLRDLKYKKSEERISEWAARAGKTIVTPIGPGVLDWQIFVNSGHGGRTKYSAAVAKAFQRFQHLVELKVLLAKHVADSFSLATDRTTSIALKDLIEHFDGKLALADKIQRARNDLEWRVSTLGSLAVLSHVDRRNAREAEAARFDPAMVAKLVKERSLNMSAACQVSFGGVANAD